MKKIIFSIVVSLLLGFGVGYVSHRTSTPVNEPVLRGLYNPNTTQFVAGLTAGSTNQFSVTATGTLVSSADVQAANYKTATIGSSSSSPAALGSASAGHFIVAAGSTTAFASTTAVTANSIIKLTVEQTTPIAGTTCSTSVPTSTPAVSALYVGNGFKTTLATSFGQPLCLNYQIIN